MRATDARHALLLLQMAKKDLRALQAMLDPDRFEDEIFGFHCQQAAEKALKAWISLLGVEYQKVHDLAELLSALEDHVAVPERFSDLLEYNVFAVQHRYLPFGGDLGPTEREKMLGLVEDLLEHVQALMDCAEE